MEQTQDTNLKGKLAYEYRRKSNEADERQIYSLEDQAKCNKRTAERAGLVVKKELEEAKSAKVRDNRPLFNALLEAVGSGSTQVIVCWNANRLARNAVEGAFLIDLMDQGKLQAIVTDTKTYFDTPEDKWMLMVEFANSKKYSDDLSKVVKRGMQGKFERGGWPNQSKSGYKNIRNELGESIIVADEERFPLLKKAFELFLTGTYSGREVLDKLNKEWGYRTRKTRKSGGKKLSLSAIYKFLRDPYYYGIANWSGQTRPIDPSVPRLITEEQYWRIQDLLGRRGVPRPSVYKDLMYRGLIRCGECGYLVTPYAKRKKLASGTFATYFYVKCGNKDLEHCHQIQVSLESLDEQILKILDSISVSQDFVDWAVKWLKRDHESEAGSQKAVLHSLTRNLKDLQSRFNELLDLRLGKQISDEEFTDKREKLTQEIKEAERSLKDLNQRSLSWADQMERAFNFAKNARTAFEGGDTKVKMTILQAIGANFALKDKILCVELKKPFLVLADNEKVVKQELQRIELDDLVLVGAKKEDFGEPISQWWAIMDSDHVPPHYQCGALPVELIAQLTNNYID